MTSSIVTDLGCEGSEIRVDGADPGLEMVGEPLAGLHTDRSGIERS